MSANVVTTFYLREKLLHGLGNRVEYAFSLDELLEKPD